MILKDVQNTHDTYSGTASQIARQLAFAGLAVIWVFKTDSGVGFTVNDSLLVAGFYIIISLTLDFLQYVYGSIAWHGLHVKKEKEGVGTKTIFQAPKNINLPTHILFYAKLIFMLLAYYQIIFYLIGIFTNTTA